MNESSSTNTILLVIVIALVVGALVWFFAGRGAAEPSGASLEVNVPTTGGAGGE